MATQETQQLDAVIDNSRRRMLALGGTALAGLALAGLPKANAATLVDTDYLNFALNLEYLEANYYNLAVYGVTIDKLPTNPVSILGGGTTAGTVTTKSVSTQVAFVSPLIKAYATEVAAEEAKHVTFLQSALGSAAVAMPNLDLYNSFNKLAASTTPKLQGGSFDPFANDGAFLIGSYIFEDVGVSAYHGAAGLITDKTTILPAAVKIHAVEAYHAGLIRTTMAAVDAGLLVLTGAPTFAPITQAISNLRSSLANPAPSTTVDDVGLTTMPVALNGNPSQYNASTIVDAPLGTTSISPGRTTAQVLAIVTAANSGGGTTTSTGLFFPNGMNGNIA